jgi:hypothetical protein
MRALELALGRVPAGTRCRRRTMICSARAEAKVCPCGGVHAFPPEYQIRALYCLSFFHHLIPFSHTHHTRTRRRGLVFERSRQHSICAAPRVSASAVCGVFFQSSVDSVGRGRAVSRAQCGVAAAHCGRCHCRYQQVYVRRVCMCGRPDGFDYCPSSSIVIFSSVLMPWS